MQSYDEALDDTAVLTLIGGSAPLPLAEIEQLPAQWGAALRAERCLSRDDSGAPSVLELYLDGCDLAQLRPQLPALWERWRVDACLQPAADKRPRRRLLVFDMDSTLIRCEVIDELAARAGVGEEVAAITARAMRGEIDFRASFTARMGRLRGLAETELQTVADALPIMPGAPELFARLNALGHHTAILSGGFDYFAHLVQRELRISEVHANHLHIEDGYLTGAVDGPIVDGERKEQLLREVAAREGFALADTVAVGDGANDLPMLATAGIGVAFHAKPVVRETARCAITHADLDALLYLLGEADAG
jgi:phosphoserine phosphatase